MCILYLVQLISSCHNDEVCSVMRWHAGQVCIL